MLHNTIATLPNRVRPASYEALDSYEQRLRDANHYSSRTWNTILNATLRAHTDLNRAELVERLGGLQAGHFDRGQTHYGHADGTTCNRCTTGIEVRYACTRCTNGAAARQVAHDGPRVCRRHKRWVGPGAGPDEQFTVDPYVLRADRAYQRLRRVGRADALLLAEMLACIDAWTQHHTRPLNPADRFVLAVGLVGALGKQTPCSATETEAEEYAAVTVTVSNLTEGEHLNVLVDAVWLLLRAARHLDPGAPHTFPSVVAPNGNGAGELQMLTSSFYPRVRHLQLTQLVHSPAPGTRFQQAERVSDQNEYVCPRGHRYTALGQVLRTSKASGGCGYCARRKVAPGNSLADTHPVLAAEWHPTLNGDVSPSDVLAGTGNEYAWLCTERGHTFLASPNSRTTKRSGCGYCANLLVDETNCLRTTHPHLAQEWNVALNGALTPDIVVAGSEQHVWWACSEGHDFYTTVTARAGGSGCHVCTRQVVHSTTCLAATHPDVAAKWDHERNGDLTPEAVFAGSFTKVWWLCDNGCGYDAAIVSKVKGVGCRYCSNRGVNERNSMRATNPELAAQMHPTKNGKRTPDNVVAGTRHRLWWLCEHGHDWPATGDNRLRQDAGCPFCNNRKVWSGFNDMASCRPDLAAQFDSTKNGDLTPETIVVDTWRPLHWKCAKGHEWRATGESRAVKGRGCRDCAAKVGA